MTGATMSRSEASLPVMKEALSVFSAEECDEIIELGKSMVAQEGLVVSSGRDPLPEGGDERDYEAGNRKHAGRRSTVAFLDRADERTEWVYQRLAKICVSANEKFWNFSLKRSEGIQFTTYETGNFYRYHMDLGVRGWSVFRKLSATVQLSDPADYEGGQLVLMSPEGKAMASRERGSVVVFPSYVWHQVRPVKRGVRHSLVQWVSGEEPFR